MSASAWTGRFWSVAATLLSGLVVWGGIGLGVDHLLGTRFFVAVGLLVGHLGSLYIVYLRLSEPDTRPSAGGRGAQQPPDRKGSDHAA